MKRIGKACSCFMLLFFMIIGFKLDVHAESINSGQVVDSHKIWTIKFNDSIKFDNFSKNYIKVTNSKGILQESQLELCEDKKSIRVKPNSNGYNPGEKYTLKITKGLKSGKNKDLKKEIFMDFSIKQDGSSDVESSSPNNKENESLVVQDGEWVYYSDFTYNASIYKMKRDGSSKKLIYKGNDRICQLNASNGYIYFASHTPDTPEEAYTIFRVKNDGTSKAEIICYNLSVYNQYQIYKNNIYYVYMSKLYKCDLDGKNPKELLNNIENKTDDVFFMIKDDLIYYWGFNYLTGKETGIYKMKIDGSSKQCLVKNTDAQNMLADTINVDDEYIYYKNFSGMVYKSDLKGNNIQKVTFLNKISAINAYKGYIYYLYEGTIYKIKPDGTEQSIIAHQVDDDSNYINIVNGYLWYFDVHDEIKSVALNNESSGNGLEPEGNVSLKDGETFYVKGVNNPSSKIIKCTSEDVNGDGKKENIIFTGDYVNYVYNNLKLFVQNTSNGEIISYDALSTPNCEDVGNTITLGDFNKDKVKDIKIDLLTNMQRGIHSTYIYSLSNNKLNKIFDDTMIPNQGQDFKYELLSNRNIKVSNNNDSYYLVDLSKDNDAHYNNLMSTGLGTSLTIWYEGEDSDKDGSLELSRNIYLVGVSYSDFLCKVKTTYKFNQTTGKWENKDLSVESEYHPCNKVGINKPDEEDNNGQENNEQENNQTGNNEESNTGENTTNQEEDKSAIQSLVEKDGFAYYVQEYWTSSGSGYYLSDSSLYKVNKTSGERKVIAKNCHKKIQISGDWIYYISRYGGDLRKVKLDGTSDTSTSISGVRNFSILGDWLYYCDNMYGSLGSIYKMKLDGTELAKLNNEPAQEMAVFEDWVYYINSNNKICRVRVDGTSTECLEEIATHSLGVNKNGIYYSVRHSAASSLHKMDHDGTNSKWISNEIVGRYSIYDEFIYYIDYKDKCIYRMNANGSGAVKLSDTKANDIIGVSADSIYYIAGDEMDSEQVYTLKINR